jgi:hypothetical protein
VAQSNEELTRFDRLMSNREMHVIELKQQINDLSAQLGLPRPYPLAFMHPAAEEIVRHTTGHGEPNSNGRGMQKEQSS